MNNENWTKGEWSVDGFTVYALNEQGANQFIAHLQGNGRHGAAPKELLANAYLMKASKDLFWALKDAEEVLRDVAMLSGLTHVESCADNALQALKKARGEL